MLFVKKPERRENTENSDKTGITQKVLICRLRRHRLQADMKLPDETGFGNTETIE